MMLLNLESESGIAVVFVADFTGLAAASSDPLFDT